LSGIWFFAPWAVRNFTASRASAFIASCKDDILSAIFHVYASLCKKNYLHRYPVKKP
jgi:hypothetical protein